MFICLCFEIKNNNTTLTYAEVQYDIMRLVLGYNGIIHKTYSSILIKQNDTENLNHGKLEFHKN